ncbi:hypothetical protein H4Q26_004273 [Puccinia striiformis f. sp. tritici PST-130]|nr:hypothetical protein H4Q26_004273 [Puccinia striiformis f. sp. tritici PST-130]
MANHLQELSNALKKATRNFTGEEPNTAKRTPRQDLEDNQTQEDLALAGGCNADNVSSLLHSMVGKQSTKASSKSFPTTSGKVIPNNQTPLSNESAISHQANEPQDATSNSANQGVGEDSPDEIDDEFVQQLRKVPEVSAEQRDKARTSETIPIITTNSDEKEAIWAKVKEAQDKGDEFLVRILLKAYGDLDNIERCAAQRPSATKTSSANPILLTVDRSPQLPTVETETEDDLIYAVGTVTSHQDIGFTPYLDENIRKLKAPLPLTIFDKEWQKEAWSIHVHLKHPRSSEDKAYKGHAWLSEWTQTRTKWTSNHRSFHLTLRDSYGKVRFAAKLLKHKENCDAIADQYGFMTAFRYDMEVRKNTFLHRIPSKDGAAVSDIEVRQELIIEMCYTTVRTNMEAAWIDNYYASGGTHAFIDPETGKPWPPTRSQSYGGGGIGRDRDFISPSHLPNYGYAQHYQPVPFANGFAPGPSHPHEHSYPTFAFGGNHEQYYNSGAGYHNQVGFPNAPGQQPPPQGPRKRQRGYQGSNFIDGFVDRRAAKKDNQERGGNNNRNPKK